MDEETLLEVGFAVNVSDLTAAGSAIDGVFSAAADSAASAGSDISASLTSAAESFSAISDAADQMSAMTAEGAASAVESLDIIPSASENAASSFTSIQEAIDSLSVQVTESVAAIDAKIETIGTTADETAAKSKSSFDGFDLGGMVTSVGMGVIALQAVGTVAEQTANELLAPAMAAENTQASFSNLMGSASGASDELGKLNTFAAQTQFKTQDIDDMAAKMIAFKTPTAEVIPEITAVGDALTAIGKGTPAEMGSVVDILGKMGIAGVVTEGNLSDLGTHGIDAFSAIEKGSGLSKDALQAMIADGTLPSADAIKYLTKGIEENPVYSGGMAKQAETLSGQMSTLASNWDQALAQFGSPIVKGLEGQVGDLSKTISSPSFKAFAAGVGKDVMQAFKDIGGAVQNAGKFFDNPSFKKLADILGGDLSADVKSLAKYLDSPAFGTFSKILGEDIAGGLLTVTQDIGILIDDGKGLVDFFSTNQLAMDALVAVLGGLTLGAIAFAATAIPGLVIGFGAWAIGAATAGIATLVAAAPFIIVGAIAALAIFGIVEAIQHWSTITAFVGDVVKNVMGGVGSFFGGVGHTIQGVFSAIGAAAENVGKGISGAFKGAVNGVITGLNWLINAVDSFHVSIPPLVVAGVTVFGGVDLGLPPIPNIPLMAKGGVIGAGQYAIAGETGAELIYGGSSGVSVLGASQSSALLNSGSGGSGGSGGTTHVHIHIAGNEVASFLIDPIMNKVVKVIRGQGGMMRGI